MAPFAVRYKEVIGSLDLPALERRRRLLERQTTYTTLQEVRRMVALQCVVEAIAAVKAEIAADMRLAQLLGQSGTGTDG